MTRALVCGSRDFKEDWLVFLALDSYLEEREVDPKTLTIVSGAARGADTLAAEWARRRGINLEEYPADWNKYGRAAGPVRNKQMLDSGVDIVIAFPKGESKGTRHMMKIAREAGVEVVAVE
jgi:hypothetical protein